MTEENLKLTLQIVGLVLTCINMLAAAAAAYLFFTGDSKAKASGKAEDGNGYKTFATVILVGILVLNMFGFIGSGVTFALPTAPAAEPTLTVPDQPQPDQPNTQSEPQPTFEHMMPGPVKVTNMAYKGMSYVTLEGIWKNEEHTAVQLWLNTPIALSDNFTVTDSVNGDPLHFYWAWTTTDGKPWASIYKDACFMAKDILAGSLGTTDVSINYTNKNGAYLTPLGSVPDSCVNEPTYIIP